MCIVKTGAISSNIVSFILSVSLNKQKCSGSFAALRTSTKIIFNKQIILMSFLGSSMYQPSKGSSKIPLHKKISNLACVFFLTLK